MLTGCPRIYSEFNGQSLARWIDKREEFGTISKVYVSKDTTTFLWNPDDKMDAKISEYIQKLPDSKLRKERIAKLTNGIGFIYIGGNSDTEKQNLGMLCDDAQSACFSAAHGVVPGGGYTLGRLIHMMEEGPIMNAAKKVLEILHDGAVPDFDLDASDTFNILTGKWEKIDDTDVYDSLGVAKAALINAVSVVCEVLKTKYTIIHV